MPIHGIDFNLNVNKDASFDKTVSDTAKKDSKAAKTVTNPNIKAITNFTNTVNLKSVASETPGAAAGKVFDSESGIGSLDKKSSFNYQELSLMEKVSALVNNIFTAKAAPKEGAADGSAVIAAKKPAGSAADGSAVIAAKKPAGSAADGNAVIAAGISGRDKKEEIAAKKPAGSAADGNAVIAAAAGNGDSAGILAQAYSYTGTSLGSSSGGFSFGSGGSSGSTSQAAA